LAPALFEVRALLNPFGTLEGSVHELAELCKQHIKRRLKANVSVYTLEWA